MLKDAPVRETLVCRRQAGTTTRSSNAIDTVPGTSTVSYKWRRPGSRPSSSSDDRRAPSRGAHQSHTCLRLTHACPHVGQPLAAHADANYSCSSSQRAAYENPESRPCALLHSHTSQCTTSMLWFVHTSCVSSISVTDIACGRFLHLTACHLTANHRGP